MKNIEELWKEYNTSAELLKLRLNRTSNLLGEYAEYLVSEYLKGELLTASNANADVRAPNGDLHQVKARKISNILTTQLSIIRSWDFDYLTIILFDQKGSVIKALICPKSVSKNYAVYNAHQNGWVITTSSIFLNDENHIDITTQLRDLNKDDHMEAKALFQQKGFIHSPKTKDSSNLNYKEIEVDKVIRKLPKWFKNPDYICTRILIIYLELEKQIGSVTYETLSHHCSGIKTFKSNFDQMKNFGEKNHGKVFEKSGSIVTLWSPVKSNILKEYSNHYKKIRDHYGMNKS